MGRRAKNKQGDPAPLHDRDSARTKKPGKRKAEDDGPKRSPKKIKATSGSVAMNGDKSKSIGKAKVDRSNRKAEGKENREGSLGWEDMDDGNLEAHAAYE
jgi:25S rRNA (cytosine2870-C5)-methyltransferase